MWRLVGNMKKECPSCGSTSIEEYRTLIAGAGTGDI